MNELNDYYTEICMCMECGREYFEGQSKWNDLCQKCDDDFYHECDDCSDFSDEEIERDFHDSWDQANQNMELDFLID